MSIRERGSAWDFDIFSIGCLSDIIRLAGAVLGLERSQWQGLSFTDKVWSQAELIHGRVRR